MIQYESRQLVEDFHSTFGRDPHRAGDFEDVMKHNQWKIGRSSEGKLGTWTLIEHNGLNLKFELTGEGVRARLSIEWEHDGYSWFDVSVYAYNSTPMGTYIGSEPVSEEKLNTILKNDLKRLRELTKDTKSLVS